MTTGGNGQAEDEVCNEVGAPLEWSRACLSYAIDVRGSQWMNRSDLEGAIDLAFEEWENVDCGGGNPPSVVFQPLQASTCQRAEYNCEGNVNTIAFLDPFGDPCGGRYRNEAFAVTVVWHSEQTGQIFDADMMINDQLASGSSAGGPYANCPDTGCPPAPISATNRPASSRCSFSAIGLPPIQRSAEAYLPAAGDDFVHAVGHRYYS